MKRLLKRMSIPAAAIALLAIGITAAGAGSGDAARGHDPALSPPGLAVAIAAQEKNTESLLGLSGVVGTAVSEQDGNWVVNAFVSGPGVRGIPEKLDGVDVVVRVTGKFQALHHRPWHSGGPAPSPPPPPPPPPPSPPPATPDQASIGTSTGNAGQCSSGTIALRGRNGTDVYAVSNNHVYALENTAPIGSDVLHPGLLDTSCIFDPGNVIGTLFGFKQIMFSTTANNRIDAAVATTSEDRLGTSTPADGYGTPTSTTAAAAVNQKVMKYGRTTSLTKGQITAINATVLVSYDSGTARFVGQIIAEAKKPFIKPGDSGSLLVTDPGKAPVGLLFAGNSSGKLAIANDIDDVLNHFGITIDGT